MTSVSECPDVLHVRFKVVIFQNEKAAVISSCVINETKKNACTVKSRKITDLLHFEI